MGRVGQGVSARGFRSCSANQAASNFTMPALSPTMTEGNIANWKVKEGDSFIAGDVLLEIETDKATMDVEAQDDGVVAKILMADGSKGVKVGTRIGVLAEAGDDLQSLDIPAEESAKAPSPKEEGSTLDSAKTSESQAEAPPTSKPSADASAKPSSKSNSGKAKKQTYPLLPSVQSLLREHGLDASVIDSIKPSGPNNRLLKGDVLAYLGSISSSYPAELSGRIEKLSHLDLSNIKLALPPPAPKPAAPSKVEIAEPASKTQVAIPISMTAVLELQRRVQKTLHVTLPLSTLIARATDFANDELPKSKTAKPTADELFNQVLGLDKVQGTVRGKFLPQVSAFPPQPVTPASTPQKQDLLDILSGKSAARRPKSSTTISAIPAASMPTNLFSLSVPRGDEARAKLFLERVKSVLESEPGRLIL